MVRAVIEHLVEREAITYLGAESVSRPRNAQFSS